ncbi:crossover junction endodeoxyribonuclease RuvC [Candidatus Shapirobacteria bacterium]|nr:crossover junction endodeoxyribonuclease RuvC [Candidatus Shapirobacteria bacterium]
MIILGIDPGLENTGWGIVETRNEILDSRIKLVYCGVIVSKKAGKRSEERLKFIYDELEKIIKKYKVTEMAMESLFFAKNAKSALKVAEAIGVVKLCGINNGLAVKEFTPLQVKMALVGYGRAEKDQVETMVRMELGLDKPISPSHASDAVAVALTAGFTMKIA